MILLLKSIYYGFSMVMVALMLMLEIGFSSGDFKRKKMYLIPVVLFPISFVIAYILKLVVVLVVDFLESNKGKSIISWFNQDLEFKKERKHDS